MRIGSKVRTAVRLRKGGATLASIILYSVRQRLASPYNRIDTVNGVSIVSPVGEPLAGLFEEIWVDDCYTRGGFEIGPGDTIVDIGANVGVFTLWVASRSPEARVIAVEPSSRLCSALRKNLASSRARNVTVIEAACGGRHGEATLYRRGSEVANSLYCRDAYGSRFTVLARVPVVTLDEVFDDCGVGSCALLKLDCEGAEYEILLGARRETLLKMSRISMEYHIGLNEHRAEELETLLGANGFEVERMPRIDEEGGYLYATRREVDH